jgi:hypothetical protein
MINVAGAVRPRHLAANRAGRVRAMLAVVWVRVKREVGP